MNKLLNKWFWIALIFVVGAIVIYVQFQTIKSLKLENSAYQSNTNTLLTEAHQFKVRDSLAAVKVQQLSLKLQEYQRYRSDDLALIKDLQVKNKNLATVNTVQATMIAELEGKFQDTVIITKLDTLLISDTLRHLHIQDNWILLDGYARGDEFVGRVESRDSLLIATEVKYKRFLGFLWETSKIKDRTVSVISRNPHTAILNSEFVEIRK